MKTLTTMTAIAALVAGISFANAQNAATPNTQTPPPSSINAGGQTNSPNNDRSGMQSSGSAQSSAKSGKMNWSGNGRFCITQVPGGMQAECKFASMQACETAAKPQNLNCYAKGSATTGMKTNAK